MEPRSVPVKKAARKTVGELRPEYERSDFGALLRGKYASRIVAESNGDASEPEVSAGMEAWHQVYEGLSDEEIAEVESMALNRSGFSGEKR